MCSSIFLGRGWWARGVCLSLQVSEKRQGKILYLLKKKTTKKKKANSYFFYFFNLSSLGEFSGFCFAPPFDIIFFSPPPKTYDHPNGLGYNSHRPKVVQNNGWFQSFDWTR